MAGKKTSAEQTKEEQKDTQVGNLLDAAFGDLGGLQKAAEEDIVETTEVVEETIVEEAPVEEVTEDTQEMPETEAPLEEEVQASPSGPPSGPPAGPPPKSPTGPPSGPPPKSPAGPPSGPPSKSPAGPPPGPPSDESVTETPDNHPSSSPTEPPSEPVSEDVAEPVSEDVPGPVSEDVAETPSEPLEVEEITPETEAEELPVEDTPVESIEDFTSEEGQPALDDPQMLAEQEIARLNAEVERLRQSMAGVADVIEELETPPMPPAVIEDIVIGAYIVSDFARLARQLNREQLIRATMGNIAMLHPDNLGIMIATRNRTMLPRLDERGLCAGLLGRPAPRGAPADWRIMEVILASVSLVTGGPAAVIHSHGAYTTAASCEKDLVLVQPIDGIGKEQIGKVIIVDPDEDNPDDFLRQIVEALKQGGMRCVVVRGMGAYAVGADLDQAWANAAMLEHSMRIVLLARQANLKI